MAILFPVKKGIRKLGFFIASLVFLGVWQAAADSVEVDWTFNGFSTDQITINTGDEVDIVNYDDTFDLQVTGAPPESFYADVPPSDGVNVYYTSYVYNNPGTFSFSDELGNSVTVTVNALSALSIGISAPANDAVFIAPATIAVTGVPVGGVAPYVAVEFFVGTNSVGVADSDPFTATITNLPAGNYNFSAVVTDADFNTATNSISVAVVPPPLLTATWSGNQFIVSWPASNADGVFLESTASLKAGGTWSAVSSAPVLVGSQWVVTYSISGGSQFFRLSSQ